MNSAAEVLEAARALGVRIELAPRGMLRLSAMVAPPQQFKDAVGAHKPELLALLRRDARPVVLLLDDMRRRGARLWGADGHLHWLPRGVVPEAEAGALLRGRVGEAIRYLRARGAVSKATALPPLRQSRPARRRVPRPRPAELERILACELPRARVH